VRLSMIQSFQRERPSRKGLHERLVRESEKRTPIAWILPFFTTEPRFRENPTISVDLGSA